jgi:alanine-glyoxylate transaminase/serine-glyoxylate transaminase/serine-pyruvate transaminase
MVRKKGFCIDDIPVQEDVLNRLSKAMDRPVRDLSGDEIAQASSDVLHRLRKMLQCDGPVIVYPSSTRGAWEGALVNTLSPGDHILIYETGYSTSLIKDIATRLNLVVDVMSSDWRRGVDANSLERKLRQDRKHNIKAICIVHDEASTGCRSNIADVRDVIDAVQHPALLFVDVLSSLCTAEFRQQDWGVDVAVGAMYKGLMLPGGISFNAISTKAALAARTASLSKHDWSWAQILTETVNGTTPFKFAPSFLFGLSEALDTIQEWGLEAVIARHEIYGEAVRRAVKAWNLDILCVNPSHYSNSSTSVLIPLHHSSDYLRQIVFQHFELPLGKGYGRVKDKVFRINHVGWLDETQLIGHLSAIEMGLNIAQVPHKTGGVQAAINFFSGSTAMPAVFPAAS